MKILERFMTKNLLALLLITLLFTSNNIHSESISNNPIVYTITVTDVITQGTSRYIQRGIEAAEAAGADAIVLLIDTPGGLVDATLDIMENMLSATIPVLTYVEPQGAIAASAGSFILVSGHIAAMSPGTTVGAAMPITLGVSEDGTTTNPADQKTINFLAGHIKSIANERNHNGETASKFVTDNLTLDVNEALDQGIIDFIAISLDDLLLQSDGITIDIGGSSVTLNTANAAIYPIELTAREKATNFISNPQISFLMVLAGIFGLIIGFNAPETYIPEVAGAILLVIGLYGVGMFEINIFAALIILLGIAFLVAEALTPTYGVLSFAGILSIIIGGIFLPKEPLMPDIWGIRFRFFVVGIGIGLSILMVIILKEIIKIRKKPPAQGDDVFKTLIGRVTKIDDYGYMIKINGELWHATCESNRSLTVGQNVRVVERNGIELIVAEIEESQ